MNKFAIIDLGSNSCRLYIVEQQENKPVIIHKERKVVRLGSGSFGKKELQPDGMERAAAVLSSFRQTIDTCGIDSVTAFATSAVRDASNKHQFVEMIRAKTGLHLQVLSGNEEAQAVYEGIKSNIPLSQNTDLFLDIGGGSAEVICADKHTISFVKSFPLGAVRLYESSLNTPNYVSDTQYEALLNHVKSEASALGEFVSANQIHTFFGTSGTVVNLGMATAYRIGSTCSGIFSVSAVDLRQTITILRDMTLAEKQVFPGIIPDRADIIIAGAAILDGLMSIANAETLTVTNFSIKDGIAARHMR